MAYSGSPTGTSYKGSAQGAALIALDDANNVHVERVTLSQATWHNIHVKELHTAKDIPTLLELLSRTVSTSVREVDNAFVCLSLHGQTELYDELDAHVLQELSDQLTAKTGAAVTVMAGQLYPAVETSSYKQDRTPLAETLKLIARLEMDEATMKKAIEYALSTEGFYTLEEGKAYPNDAQTLINGLDKYVSHAMLKESQS